MSLRSGRSMVSRVNDAQAAIIEHRRKRRRIRLACSDCRRKKIKCDGRLPCSNCMIDEQECTYIRQAKPRCSGPKYAEELENKIERLQAVLANFLPNMDLNDPHLGTALAEQIRKLKDFSHKVEYGGVTAQEPSLGSNHGTASVQPDELLDTMIEATSQLSIDGSGRAEYYGGFSALKFLQRIREHCSQLLHAEIVEREIFSQLSVHQAVCSPRSSHYFLNAEPVSNYLLPSRTIAQQLAQRALTEACCLINFIHRPSFDRLLDRVYDLKSEEYTLEEERFLPLLYMSLAIGDVYFKSSEEKTPRQNNPEKIKGAKFFRAAQTLIDIMDCRDMMSLQTVLCMILYLQSSGLMHSCYSYICVATASAIRMGLHRLDVARILNPVEQQVRKRTFWALRTMDTYVTTLLGLPKTLRDEDIDQELPCDLGNEFITEAGILSLPERNNGSIIPAVNAHTKLLLILSKVVRNIYPEGKQYDSYSSYRVNYGKVVKVEAELDEWFRNITQPFRQGQSISLDELRVQLLLRLAYAHVQMILYRPFIHHIVRTKREGLLELRSYACASACVKAAMQVVWLVDEMDSRGLLNGAYWFTVYMTFFAVMSLCMLILGNVEDPTVDDTMKAASRGRDILVQMALQSTNAERCLTVLEKIFEETSALWSKRGQHLTSHSRSESRVGRLPRDPNSSQGDSSETITAISQTTAQSNISSMGVVNSDMALSHTISDGNPSSNYAQHELIAMVYPGGYQAPNQIHSNTNIERFGLEENTSMPHLELDWLPQNLGLDPF